METMVLARGYTTEQQWCWLLVTEQQWRQWCWLVVVEQQWVARSCRPAMETIVGGSWLLTSNGDYDAMGLGRGCQRAMETVLFADGY